MFISFQMRKKGAMIPLGTWTEMAANTKTMNCTTIMDTITHSNTNAKNDAVFKWKAPENVEDELQLVWVKPSSYIFVCCCFTPWQQYLYQAGDMMYEMRRRKPDSRVFNFPQHIGMVWVQLTFDDTVSYT